MNLDNLSVEELQNLQKQATHLLELRSAEVIQDAYDNMKKIASSVGMTIEELAAWGEANKKQKRPRKPVEVKYRDAEGNEWTGRGRTPIWLEAHIAAGKSKEDFVIV